MESQRWPLANANCSGVTAVAPRPSLCSFTIGRRDQLTPTTMLDLNWHRQGQSAITCLYNIRLACFVDSGITHASASSRCAIDVELISNISRTPYLEAIIIMECLSPMSSVELQCGVRALPINASTLHNRFIWAQRCLPLSQRLTIPFERA